MAWGRTLSAVLCALWLAASAALAFDALRIDQAERVAKDLRGQLDAAAQLLRNPALTDQQLADQRVVLEEIRTKAINESGFVAGPIAELNQQLESLGPAPAEGATEAESVAKTRADLRAALDRLQSVKSQLDVVAVEAEQQSGRVAALQRDQFFQRIFDRNRSILNPGLWYDTSVGTALLATRIGGLLKAWWSEVTPTAKPAGLLLIPTIAAILALGYFVLRRWISRWTMAYTVEARSPDDIRRLWRIVRGMITMFAAVVVVIVPIELALEAGGYLTPRFALVLNAIIAVFGGTVLYSTLIRRITAPGMPIWRIIDLDDGAASRFAWLTGLASFVAVTNAQLSELADALFLPVNYSVGQSAFAALALLSLLSLILITLRNQSGFSAPGGRTFFFTWFPKAVPFLWLIIITGFLALLLGYLSLANYLAQKLFRTALLVAILFLLHYLTDAAMLAISDPQSGLGRLLRRFTRMGERAIERLALVVRTAVDIVLVTAGVPLLFVLWTVTWVDFGSLLNTAAIGIRLGEITVSPWTMVLVLFILAAGIVFTNIFNRWLDRRILSETRLDKGVRDSIGKGASYAGYILAAGFALGAAGFQFSSIAIVAGALGVGIGFGLQSIVNNFISGLILLAERPIRVGDWVALDAGEGLVKRINVRSTEIETFDSCSIIVPNLSLITGVVRNWTHDDTIGRFGVVVTVEIESDAAKVRDTLLQIARNHDKVLTYPEPSVTLAKVTPIGLEFDLRGTVANVFDAGKVASDIRFAILDEFRHKAISLARQPAFALTKE